MNDVKTRIRKRIPIRRRFLQTVLLTTIMSILAVSITGLVCISWNRITMKETLERELEVNLKGIMQEKAGFVDAKLEHYEKYIELELDLLEKMYAHEKAMVSNGRVFYPPSDTGEYMLTRGFSSRSIAAEDRSDEMRFFSNLEDSWDSIMRENEDIISSIYIGTTDGLLVSYDKNSYEPYVSDGKELIYNYYVSEWYKKGLAEDGIFYTGVYVDSQGRGLTISIGSAFTDRSGEKAGIICMDFNLSGLYDDLFSTDPDNGTFVFAMNNEGTIISPDSDTLDLQEYTGLSLDDLDELLADTDGIKEINDSVYVYIPLERVGWILFASTPIETIHSTIMKTERSIWMLIIAFIVIVLLIILLAVLSVNRSVEAIIHPLELLGRDIKIISDGDLNYRAAVYRNDEIGDITSGMNEMVDRLNFTMNELMSSQQHADAMSRLATIDALTGIRNKTAFDRNSKIIQEKLSMGEARFGFAMLDLNNLKLINDNYGHEKGDIAIKKLCRIICEVFDHSPVFRVGGDEFVVILENEDYDNIEILVRRFRDKINISSGSRNAEPWERVSAAIGYALYDESRDNSLKSVLDRADHEMYNCKKMMKGIL